MVFGVVDLLKICEGLLSQSLNSPVYHPWNTKGKNKYWEPVVFYKAVGRIFRIYGHLYSPQWWLFNSNPFTRRLSTKFCPQFSHKYQICYSGGFHICKNGNTRLCYRLSWQPHRENRLEMYHGWVLSGACTCETHPHKRNHLKIAHPWQPHREITWK